jgi:hypothetical protein
MACMTVHSNAIRQGLCPACETEVALVTYRNSEGQWYCRCLTCACRFWAARH